MALAVSYPKQTRNSRTALVYQIPGMPPLETTDVEGLPQVRPGQHIPLTNDEWFPWVPKVLAHIRKVRLETADNAPRAAREKARERELRLIAQDERYWLNSYAAIFESRAEEDSEELESEEATDAITSAGLVPFILYPFQDYWVTWHRRALRTRGGKGDTITIKSRDMGVTNTAVGTMGYRWMTRRIYHGRLLSRNEELVDASGDPDAMFWKVDQMLRTTPRYVLEHFVPGFNWKVHRRDMVLEHPTRYNLLKGESTNATAGRGKRAFEILLDEFTFMQRLREIWTATRAASPHRTAVGSVSTSKGLDAYNLVMSGGPAVLYLDSRLGMHPRQDAQWHAYERERDTDEGYRQEVGMDWFADSSDFVYPEAHSKTVGEFPYLPFAGPVFCTIDDGTHWAMTWLQFIRSTGRVRVIEAYRNHGKRVAFYGSLMRGVTLGDFSYGEHEQAILKLSREVPVSHFIADAHGASMEQVAGMSVIDDLALNWNIHVNVDYERRTYLDRQKTLADLLPYMDWNDTPRVRDCLRCMKMFRFRATPEGKEVMREVREPLINDDSHYPTSIEWWAMLFESFKHIYAGGEPVYAGEDNR